MEKAKAAISDFVGRSGHHDTTVHETVAPSVQKETIKPHQHEEINTAVDREVHQDHYHRTVQPIHDREVLPEQHTAKLGGVQHREFDHRDHDTTKRTLENDQAQFKDERRIDPTTTSQSVAPAVGGEHQHHHIHETIQPVVHKETVQPNVIHTTVPIHEVHHNKATHHETTALPAMTMDQFKNKGGSLTGREERYDEFEGVPKNIGGSSGAGLGSGRGLQSHTKEEAQHGETMGSTMGSSNSHNTSHTSGGLAGAAAGAAAGAGMAHSGSHGTTERERMSGQGMTGQSGMTGQQGMTGQGMSGNTNTALGGTAGPDLSGTKTKQGMAAAEQHHHSDRGMEGQGNLTGSSTQGGVASSQPAHGTNTTSNRQDQISSSTDHAHHGRSDDALGDISHSKMQRKGGDDSGELPQALTEDKSHFVPYADGHPDDPKGEHIGERKGHSKSDSVHETGDKPSMKDKLNPKVDADGDGKAGIMD